MSDKLTRARAREVSSNFRDMISHPKKKIEEAENTPAKLLRRIFIQCGVGGTQWERAVDRYYTLQYGDDIKKVHQHKSNLLRALTRNRITWKRFSEALEVIGAKEYQFTMKCEFLSGHSFELKETLRNRRINWVGGEGEVQDDQTE